MDEKVIYEFRVIKTADGFRVEMKGDKEQMHGFGFGPHMHPFGRHWGRSWSHWGRHWKHAWNPCWDESEEEKPSSRGESGSQSL